MPVSTRHKCPYDDEDKSAVPTDVDEAKIETRISLYKTASFSLVVWFLLEYLCHRVGFFYGRPSYYLGLLYVYVWMPVIAMLAPIWAVVATFIFQINTEDVILTLNAMFRPFWDLLPGTVVELFNQAVAFAEPVVGPHASFYIYAGTLLLFVAATTTRSDRNRQTTQICLFGMAVIIPFHLYWWFTQMKKDA
tara:strand:- start:361 stop:936 length:576 start_codon:yes stop_codon:yes gene_type:complete